MSCKSENVYYSCPSCDKQFKSEKACDEHVEAVHKITDPSDLAPDFKGLVLKIGDEA